MTRGINPQHNWGTLVGDLIGFLHAAGSKGVWAMTAVSTWTRAGIRLDRPPFTLLWPGTDRGGERLTKERRNDWMRRRSKHLYRFGGAHLMSDADNSSQPEKGKVRDSTGLMRVIDSPILTSVAPQVSPFRIHGRPKGSTSDPRRNSISMRMHTGSSVDSRHKKGYGSCTEEVGLTCMSVRSMYGAVRGSTGGGATHKQNANTRAFETPMEGGPANHVA